MRTLFVFISLTIAFLGCSSCQSKEPIYGWAVGENATILHTEDGESWKPQPAGVAAYLIDLCFVDRNNGWVVGEQGTILHTGDGGKVWTRQPAPAEKNLTSVFFVDAQRGWTVDIGGSIWSTSDGGNAWVLQTKTESVLQSVHFINSRDGWVAGTGGTVLRTRDGGATWTKLAAGTNEDLNSIRFRDPNNGVVVGYNSTILQTDNGGDTWSPRFHYGGAPILSRVIYGDDLRIWAVGVTRNNRQGLIVSAKPNGAGWDIQLNEALPSGIAFANSKHATIAAGSVMLNSSDGGVTWSKREVRKENGVPYILGAVVFVK